MRWRDPRAGTPFTMRMVSRGYVTDMFLDGARPPSGHTIVPFGEHVVAFAISGFPAGVPFLAFSGTTRAESQVIPDVEQQFPQVVLSAADGTWRYRRTAPDDYTWMLPGFDDSNWPAMVALEWPAPDPGERPDYQVTSLTSQGALGLGIEIPDRELRYPTDEPRRAWIRRTFTLVPPPEVAR